MQFIKILFSFLFLFHTLAFSWNISPENFTDKLQTETPSWIQRRIETDLSHFQSGLSSKEIDLCLANLKKLKEIETAGLVRIRFSQARSGFEPLFFLTSEQDTALQEFLSALTFLDSLSPLPNLDFILCLNPSFNRPVLLLQTSVPIFAVSKEKNNSKVALIPRLWRSDRETLLSNLACDWDKKTEKAFWRGFATDGPYRHYEWDCKPRARISLESRYHQDLLDARLVSSSDIDGGITRWLENLSLLSPFTPPEDQISFKYLLSLDGKASPSSFEWQLFSQSLVLKAESNQIEWFYEGLQRGVHYIPCHPRGIDLIEKILWAQSHDEQARAIAENGYLFAMHHLLDEDLFIYFFHLLHAYSELLITSF